MPNEDLKNRLNKAVISYLRGVRNELQFFEQLTKDIAGGGLGMAMEKANNTVSSVNKFRDQILSQGKNIEQVVVQYQVSQGMGGSSVSLGKSGAVSQPEDLLIDVKDKITPKPYRSVTTAPSYNHDIAQPLGKHINYHQEIVSKPLEIKAPQATVAIAQRAPQRARFVFNKKEESKADQGSLPNAPTPQLSNPLTLQRPNPPTPQFSNTPAKPKSDDISKVALKPVMEKPREIPKPIKSLIENEAAQVSGELVDKRMSELGRQKMASVITMAPEVRKIGLFAKLFKRQKKELRTKNKAGIDQSTDSPILQSSNSLSLPVSPNGAPSGQPNNSRPRLDDVKFIPKLVSPIDELGGLTLTDFRRLGRSPKDAISKIINKLDLLGMESITQQSAGVEALKRSELYGTYSDIMKESLMKGRPPLEILNTMKTMTPEEFSSLVELNKLIKQ
jgi:hypothetical protein